MESWSFSIFKINLLEVGIMRNILKDEIKKLDERYAKLAKEAEVEYMVPGEGPDELAEALKNLACELLLILGFRETVSVMRFEDS
jgi:hypothetical protein